MMHEFFLEIGCEELPPSAIDSALNQLQKNFEDKFKENSIEWDGEFYTYGTPRRLIIHCPHISEKQKDRVIEVKGPPFKIAFNSDGTPTKAGLGFARKLGVELNEIETISTDRGEYLIYNDMKKGRSTDELLPEIISDCIIKINFTRSMHWDNNNIRFARPIRRIFAVFKGSPIQFTLGNITSQNYSLGHSNITSSHLAATSFSEFKDLLYKNLVIVEISEREKLIISLLEKGANQLEGTLISDTDLVKTVARCTEYPTLITGTFASKFLLLPREVLITSMRTHQKFFALEDKEKKLLPYFLHISDNPKADEKLVKHGNEKVLTARLNDAEFFFAEDQKMSINERIKATDGITFHEQLGTMAEKSKRLIYLSVSVAKSIFSPVPDDLMLTIQRAATLCKTDLTTQVVAEFPDLQGIMGKVYASLEGESTAVAAAISEQYLPRRANDKLPSTKAGIVLSISDKIDTLCGYFKIGLIPTGSVDPYGLRRLATGICNILIEGNFHINLKKVFLHSLELYQATRIDRETTFRAFQYFISRRLETIMTAKSFKFDTINACLENAWNDPLDLHAQLSALKKFRARNDFEDLIVGFRRAARIIPKGWSGEFSVNFLEQKAEINLFNRYKALSEKIKSAFEEHEYDEVLKLLAEFREPIDFFFEKVMVMCDNIKLRENRLSLLKNIFELFSLFSDFTKIVISQDNETLP